MQIYHKSKEEGTCKGSSLTQLPSAQTHHGHVAKLKWPQLALASVHHSQNDSEVLGQAWCKLSNCHSPHQRVLPQHQKNNPVCCTKHRPCRSQNTLNSPRSSQLHVVHFPRFISKLALNQSECVIIFSGTALDPGNRIRHCSSYCFVFHKSVAPFSLPWPRI